MLTKNIFISVKSKKKNFFFSPETVEDSREQELSKNYETLKRAKIYSNEKND